MIGALLVGIALAGDPPPPPELREPVEGECPRHQALEPGHPLPSGLVNDQGLVVCGAVLVPTSVYAELLDWETYADHVAARYVIDTTQLETERDWYRTRAEDLAKPVPWPQRPGVQRWAGRVETLAAVTVAAAVVLNLDHLRID